MKKKLINISVMIFIVGIIWGASFVYRKNKKSDIKEIAMVSSKKKDKFKEEKRFLCRKYS